MRVATLLRSAAVRQTVEAALANDGIESAHAPSIEVLVAEAQAQPIAAVFLEDADGLLQGWLAALKAQAPPQTVLIAIGPGGASRMSGALLGGADDYVVLGAEDAHLVSRAMARISVKLRQQRRTAWQLGPYVLDASQGTLSSEFAMVRLSPREQVLALLLVQHRGHLVPHARLCVALCGETGPAAERALKQHAYALRKKCVAVAAGRLAPLRIEASYGTGYRLTDSGDDL